jgi:hypothetical protein
MSCRQTQHHVSMQLRDGQSTVHVGQQYEMQEGGVAYRGKFARAVYRHITT